MFLLCSISDMPKTNPFITALAEMRRVCNQAEHVMSYAKVPGSLMLVEAIMAAIDDWAGRFVQQQQVGLVEQQACIPKCIPILRAVGIRSH
jgi:hypothetical protein